MYTPNVNIILKMELTRWKNIKSTGVNLAKEYEVLFLLS